MQDLTNTVFVSPASAYEVIQKHRKGAWPEIADLAADFGGAIERAGFYELPITINDMTLAAQFPGQHKGPWDRLLAAQSILSGMPLLSEDKLIDVFRPNRIWA